MTDYGSVDLDEKFAAAMFHGYLMRYLNEVPVLRGDRWEKENWVTISQNIANRMAKDFYAGGVSLRQKLPGHPNDTLRPPGHRGR